MEYRMSTFCTVSTFFLLAVFVRVSVIDGQQEYCIAVAKCLDEAADKMGSCNRAFIAMTAIENATGCHGEIYAKQQSVAELHEDQARILANCINGMVLEWNFTCPLMNMRRRKRNQLTEEDRKKMRGAMMKVVKECKNGEDVLNSAKSRHDKGQLTSRLQIVEYIKRTCRGNTSLSVDELPGGDAKLEQLYAKVKVECDNWVHIVNKLMLKFQNREIYTRYEIVAYIQSHCGNLSSVTTDDLPPAMDAKLEAAFWKVQQNCSNSADLIKNFRTLRNNASILSEEVVSYFNSNCHVAINLTHGNVSSTENQNSTGRYSLMEKLEQSYAVIQKHCENSAALVRDIETMFEQMRVETTEQIMEYIEQHCDGRANLTADDLPLIGCHAAAKKLLSKCIHSMDKCRVAKACQRCLEKSSMRQAIVREKMRLADARKSCQKRNV